MASLARARKIIPRVFEVGGGFTYAYRGLGPKGGIPVVFFVHLAATLDNWVPRIIDPIAATRHAITGESFVVCSGVLTGSVCPAAIQLVRPLHPSEVS